MKTFLKVTLIVIGVLLAIKLLPVVLAIGCVLAGVGALLAALGASFLAVMAAIAFILALVLSPLWVPVLVVFGTVALVRRSNRTVA